MGTTPPQSEERPDLSLSVVTNAYSGYELTVALDHVRDAVPCDSVELDAIDGLFAHVDPAAVSDAVYRAEAASMLSERGLRCGAISAQIPAVANLDDKGRAEMQHKMRLAQLLGTTRLNVGAGGAGQADAFLGNLKTLVPLAQDLGVTIGLEIQGPGSLVHDRSSLDLLTSLPDGVDVNYDFGNYYFGSGGEVDLLEDFRAMLDHVGSVHLKDALPDGTGGWTMTPIEGNIVDYGSVFSALRATGRDIHIAIELPLRFVLGQVAVRPEVPSLERIDGILTESVRNVRSIWAAAEPNT